MDSGEEVADTVGGVSDSPVQPDVRAVDGRLAGARGPDGSGGEKRPFVELVMVGAPVVATMTSYTVMQFVDKLMVSRIGPDPIYVGAQGNGGLAAFVPIAVFMGFITVINTYVSQNLGAGRPERAPAYVWTGLWIGLGGWALLLLPWAAALPWVFRAIGQPGDVAALSSEYGGILLAGSVVTLGARAVSQYFYGMHKPGVVLISNVSGNLVNVGLNYCLIYGNLGMPALGVNGAAISTVIGTCVEFAIPFAVFLGARANAAYGTRGAWRPSLSHLRDIARIGWPGAAMFGNEMTCWAFFMVYLVGGFGPRHATAGWIAHQYMSLSFMPAVGISVAMTALVGRCMGMRRPDLAAQRAWMGLWVAVGYMGLCAVCFVVFRGPLVRLFIEKDTPPGDVELLVSLGSNFLIATAAFQMFDAIAMTLNGALRGAGDTVWTGVATLVLSWTIIVGGGLALVRFAPGLGSLGPWIAAATYIFVLSMMILGRFLSGRWRRLDLLGQGEAREGLEAGRLAGSTTDGLA